MTDLELIDQLTANQELLTEKMTLAARAIDALEQRVDLFQAMLLHDPPHSHKTWADRPTPVIQAEPAIPPGDNLAGLLD